MQQAGVAGGDAGDFGSNRQPLSTGVTGMLKEIQTLKDKFKNEDEDELSPYHDLSKASVLQECRVFNDANVVTNHPRRCCQLITKLLHILTQGETLSSSETTEVFFGVTKLFQSQDANLRRMMYLFIKEVAETCNPDDVIIVTSSLTKDMNCPEDLYRANSIRVLARIVDGTMLGAIERYIKQAIVDKNALVGSSALVSGMALYHVSPEVVRRWVNEVQEAVNAPHEMVQYHALSLLYQIKAHDRLAVSKLVTQLSKGSMRSPLAVCLLIRYMCRILHEDMSATNAHAVYQFLEASLRHRTEMVIYEAARAICNLPGVEMNDLSPAITVMQLFLSSPKPTLKFGAMRTLSEVANRHPMAIVKCNEDMEAMIGDANRSVATLAITTLLKTGSEGSVDRLMKQISTFMNDIADEFKVIVVQAIRQLCLKYPQKHRVLVGFLATFLRQEGGFDFKKAIADCIVELIAAIPETKETSLFHLCDFIEDCEFPALSTQILHLVGALGPSCTAPARYIRFVYNRVILENAAVRAAAVAALAKFAARVPSLRPSIRVLLRRSLVDEDDEVRDRVTIALHLLGSDPPVTGGVDEAKGEAPVTNGDSAAAHDPTVAAPEASANDSSYLLTAPLPMSFPALERAVRAYAQHAAATEGQPLTMASLPIIEEPVLAAPPSSGAGGSRARGPAAAAAASAAAMGEVEDPAAHLYKVPELASLGRVFRSSAPVELTESETEYVVRCVKHVLATHVVLDFAVSNTIADQMLRGVRVAVAGSEPDLYDVEQEVALPSLKYDQTGHCYVVLRRAVDAPIEPATFTAELHFKVVDVDPATGEPEGDEEGFPEEYPLEDLELTTADFMAKVSLGDFQHSWKQMGAEGEVLEKFQLQFKRIDEAVSAVIDFLGMQPCDGTGSVGAAGATAKSHQLHLSGVFVGNVPVLVRSQLQLLEGGECVLKIAVRSDNAGVSRMVADCIR